MAAIKLRDYEVSFPYSTPYSLQEAYMDKVLECLDQKTHAVLESPTGTGKTLCLFAPITAWAKRKKLEYTKCGYHEPDREFFSKQFEQNDEQNNWGSKRKMRVWYTSRTHAQIAQTVAEVRKCDTEGLKVTVMGARDQLCINSDVLEVKESYVKSVKCKELVKNKHCKYYTKLSHEKDVHKYFSQVYGPKVMDIEDLVSFGRSCGICPYYLSKRASETADIVLLPYNYIIDKESRDSNSIMLQNDIIIFDEGHNVPTTCEESYEFALTELDIAIGIKNIKELMCSLTKLADSLDDENDIDVAAHASNSMLLMNILQKLEAGFEGIPLSNELLPVSALYDFFRKAGVNEETFKQVVEGIAGFKNDSTRLALSTSTLETFKLLEKMMIVMFGNTVKSFDEETIERSFKCGVTIDPERHNSVKKLSLFCFNPSFGIKNLLQLGVQSIIITSGTLSPLKTFISELSLPEPVTLENGHIAKKCQVPFVILGTGVNNVKMDGAYKNRTEPKYMSSLGLTLTNLIASIPDGVLILFSSYTMMQNLREAWESDLGVWTRLNSLKRVFVEAKNKDDFINCMENYRRAIDAGNGAILMGVLRGKISEGMDFKDQYCRGVFIIGVPFPPVHDPRVRGKEKYAESLTVLNPLTKMPEKLYNNSFMSVEAMRATNQAIGRVIRHGQDYGVIVLVDYRFAWPRLFSNISGWLRGDVPDQKNFPFTKKLVRDFFKDIHLGKLGVKEVRSQRVDSNGCPIASYVSYEEYDHKKHAPHQVPWIGASSEEMKASQRRRGHATIEYVDEESPQDLVSMYKKSGGHGLDKEVPFGSSRSGCLLDALENSRSTSVGFREFDKNGKRKYNEEESSFEVSSSPSMLSFPEACHAKQKKFPRLKVRPLGPLSAEEAIDEHLTPKPSVSSAEQKKDEDLKVKLVNYFRLVKQSLSQELDQRFKHVSCRYMKGEAALGEVIDSMDELFLIPGKKNLFSGFAICVKGKDRDQWTTACKTRKLESC